MFDALYYRYVLRFDILRHQIFCLCGIGICLIIVIITEFIFQEINIFLDYSQLLFLLLLAFIVQFCSAMVDSTEKYLFEYNNISPFFALLFEGLFGFILSFIYGIFYNPFNDINQFKKVHSSSEFTIIIISLIIYKSERIKKRIQSPNYKNIFTNDNNIIGLHLKSNLFNNIFCNR